MLELIGCALATGVSVFAVPVCTGFGSGLLVENCGAELVLDICNTQTEIGFVTGTWCVALKKGSADNIDLAQPVHLCRQIGPLLPTYRTKQNAQWGTYTSILCHCLYLKRLSLKTFNQKNFNMKILSLWPWSIRIGMGEDDADAKLVSIYHHTKYELTLSHGMEAMSVLLK